MSTLAKRLRQALDVRRVSQHALARATGLTQSHISGLASGRKAGEPQYSTVVRISRALRIDPEWLVHGAGTEPTEHDAPMDPIPSRSEAIRILRAGGYGELLLHELALTSPPGSETWPTLRWIDFARLQAAVMGDAPASSPISPPQSSRARPRAITSPPPTLATAKKK